MCMIYANKPTIVAFTDGASSRKNNIMSWAYVVYIDNEEFHYDYGVESDSTNNRMEITAMLQLLEFLKESESEIIHICSDSKYLLKAISPQFTSIQTGETEYSSYSWLDLWQKTDWISSTGTPVKNQDLWFKMIELLKTIKKHNIVKFFHTKGHISVEGNERADYLCQYAIKNYLKSINLS